MGTGLVHGHVYCDAQCAGRCMVTGIVSSLAHVYCSVQRGGHRRRHRPGHPRRHGGGHRLRLRAVHRPLTATGVAHCIATGDAHGIPPRSAYCSMSGTGCCSAQSSPVDEPMGIVHGCARALCSARNTGGCIYAVRSNGDDDVDVHQQSLPAPRWRIQNF